MAWAPSFHFAFSPPQSTADDTRAVRGKMEGYTPSTSFETFPLPWPPNKEPESPNFSGNSKLKTLHSVLHSRISTAAKNLNDQRERWLNPPEWLDPIAERIDATDDFSDVPKEARPLLRQSAIMAA